MKKTRSQNLWHPQYWGAHIGLLVIRLINRLPFRFQQAIGEFFGILLLYFARERRFVCQRNIELCFPELSPQQRKQMLKNTFKEQGIGLIELGLAWWPNPSKLKKMGKVIGLEHLLKAQNEGKGVLLLCGHFTVLDVAGIILAQYTRFDGMYRLNNNPLIEKVSSNARKKFFDELIERRDIRKLIRRLKDKHTVWYAPDQDMGKKNTVYAPFFGVPAATLTATSKIAKMTHAVVLPLGLRRDLNGEYIIEIHEPLKDFPTGDDIVDATRVNQTLEMMIRKSPTQYMWIHRRFKTHPQGKNYLYQKQKI